MPLLPNMVYRYNTMPIKMSLPFTEIEKKSNIYMGLWLSWIPKAIWKGKNKLEAKHCYILKILQIYSNQNHMTKTWAWWYTPIILTLKWLRQEDYKFWANPCYQVPPCTENKTKDIMVLAQKQTHGPWTKRTWYRTQE